MTLYELNNLIRQVIDSAFTHEYWVEAELSEARENRGHCYMELVEKDELGVTPVARASAKCWRSVWTGVKARFERATGMRMAAGMKVMLKVYPQFHEAYGFSWIVTDVDPTYTLGEMALKRKQTIEKLKAEGVFDLNREVPMPLFCQRIAVVSSQTAAGYGDFCNQLLNNAYGYAFTVELFPATMQGEGVGMSVVEALNRVFEDIDRFDCVVVIRGGGASSDLSGFDSLELAENIANFPLPVITGIGHDRDQTVADMVAHLSVKTPTAAAELLVAQLKAVDDRIDNARRTILNIVERRMLEEDARLKRAARLIPTLFSVVCSKNEARIDLLRQRLKTAADQLLSAEKQSVENAQRRMADSISWILMTRHHMMEKMEQRIEALDPQKVMSRGFSITTLNGKAVTDASNLSPGDVLTTRFANGEAQSVVKSD